MQVPELKISFGWDLKDIVEEQEQGYVLVEEPDEEDTFAVTVKHVSILFVCMFWVLCQIFTQ